MLDKTLFVTDNVASPAEYRELKAHYDSMLKKGLYATGEMTERFVKFGHYDAYCYYPSTKVWTPNDFRIRMYSPEFIAQLERQFDVKLEPEGIWEYHYHLPKAIAGYSHTDKQPVSVKEEYRTEGPCKGVYFFQGGHSYQISEKNPLQQGCVVRRRIIGCIMYLNDSWGEGEGGETNFFERSIVDGKPYFDPKIMVTPLPNRVVMFKTDDHSWHGSALAMKERKTLVWWYHAKP
jgi:hypothetical protein